MNELTTYLQVIAEAKKDYDLDKQLGTLTKPLLISKLEAEYENPQLKPELKRCSNLNQMLNVIEQMTGELSKERDQKQIAYFSMRVEQIAKFARL